MSSNEQWTALVIDNDDDLLRAVTKRLGALGIRCISAGSGAQGLAEFRASGADVVISDLNMPGGDGVELAEAIRKTSDVPIIFVTGFRDDFKRRLRNVTNVSTLRKPFETQDLLTLVSAALGESVA
ncbi:MAG TPA: response regulator [Planctomycetota bacterium]|nr:response regulator [Planctomycetota bacterium]